MNSTSSRQCPNLYEEEIDEVKEELGELRAKHSNLYAAGLDKFKDELGES